MHNIQIGEKHYIGPSKFEELTQEQFLGVVATMQHLEKHPSAKWMLLPILYNIPIQQLKRLSPEQRVTLLQVADFLYSEENLPYKEIIRKLHVKALKTKYVNALTIRTLYGPGDALKNLTFGEFMAAEQKLEAFYRSRKQEDFNAFCGILYRRGASDRKKFEDRRIPFDDSLIATFAADAAELQPYEKTAIAIQYHGAKKIFPRLFPNVFQEPEEDDTEDEQPKPKPKKSSSMTWLDTAISLAGDDVTRLPEIQKEKLHLVLKFLDEKIKDNKEFQRKLAASKKK